MGHGRLLGCMKTRIATSTTDAGGPCAAASPSSRPASRRARRGPPTDRATASVNAIAIDPATPTTVYAGTDRGGVFKSLDGGETWTPSAAGIRTSRADHDRDRGRPGDAGTQSTPARALGLGGGVFRSTDAGASWSFTSLGGLNAIAIDPATPSTVYAVGDGIRKSSDAGANWTEVQTGFFDCVAIARSSPSTVYAGGPFGMYKTTDGGATWTFVFGHPTEPILAVAIHPTMPNVVYAGVEDAGVFKTVDGGMTWNPIGPDVGGGQMLTVRGVAIDPANPDTVYAAGLTINGGFSVYKTTNGGSTWTSTPLTVVLTSAIAIDPATPTTVFVGALDDGFWKSTDGAATLEPEEHGPGEHVGARRSPSMRHRARCTPRRLATASPGAPTGARRGRRRRSSGPSTRFSRSPPIPRRPEPCTCRPPCTVYSRRSMAAGAGLRSPAETCPSWSRH